MKNPGKIELRPSKELMHQLQKQSKELLTLLKRHAKKNKCSCDFFIGGSFAKDTIVVKDTYDVDVFARLKKDKFDSDLSKLNKIIHTVARELKTEVKVVHGSRDYYQLPLGAMDFEIIPVLTIKKPEESENVTDLSYFHVNFIKRKLNSDKLRNEVRLAKAFCAACDAYGAESYIQGFSGYALECLIVHYKSLGKMLRELATVKDTVIIDSERHYKNKKDILIQLNESKLHSPVIVIDPTWKKRNALASLSKETFEKFQKHARAYLKSKSPSYFEVKSLSEEELAVKADKLKQELVVMELQTDRQEGDIAGTKLKKASNYILAQLDKEYKIKEHYFTYNGRQEAKLYLIGKPKNEILISGPPVKMEQHAAAFRQEHPDAFEKKGKLYARKQVSQSLKNYCREHIARDDNLKAMSVTDVKII